MPNKLFDDDSYYVDETANHYVCKNCSHRWKLLEIPKSHHVNCPVCGLAYDVDEKGKFQIRWSDY